ncbi:type II secretion system F family protein [Streptomyces sp.]|uniref:type II secretion system F family protein n=1 Tax=Streptomyces sp. TaxID=1931 RepID=UPI002D775FC5|nr:type II secretion system F family protein [Streptomyces sp.]HET6359867.1 type II secretion system F family protein [Streptomyces sp.]
MTADAVHRLGVLVCVVAAMAFTIAARRRRRAVRRRIQALLRVERERQRRRPEYGAWTRRWAAPLGALITGCVLVGGVTGCVVGLGGAYGVSRWQRRRKPAAGAEDQEASRQLPLAADLLAACISAGAGPREAAEAVGESLGGPVGERLARAAAELRLGGEPARAWGWFGRISGAEALGRCLERADSTGAPAAEPVSRLAERFRADRARAVAQRGRKAQVLITAPVGLCFLPAFLAVGVAPVVIGLADGLLNGN